MQRNVERIVIADNLLELLVDRLGSTQSGALEELGEELYEALAAKFGPR